MKTRILLIGGLVIAAAIFFTQVMSAQRRTRAAREALALGDMHRLRIALQLYRNQNGVYPAEDEGIAAMVNRPASATEERWRKLLSEEPLDTWRKPYVYRVASGAKPGQFELISLGPDGVESTDDIVLRSRRR